MSHTNTFAITVLLTLSFHSDSLLADEKPIKVILFGSCIKQDQQMPIFGTMLAREPELLIFLGDNIYADTTDMEVMRAKYATLKENQAFARLIEACPVLATWDDHDYGANDAGANYSQRVESQRIFVDFWADPPDSQRRRRPGVYDAKTFGPADKRLQIILLDTRYFRGPLAKGERRVGGEYVPTEDQSVTMLGEMQWKWLEEQLRKPARVRLIASSIQFIAQDAGQETWSNLPHERRRLIELIGKTKANGVLIISGDRHWSELSAATKDVPYPLYDLTSSSFNQIHPRGTPTENRFRVVKETFHRENFGAININWELPNPQIKMQIVDLDSKVQIEKTLSLELLAAE